jgi:hypothetical protein
VDTISKAMSTRSEDTRREVGAVFQSSEAFADAVFGLEAAGFDRAELSALGAEEPLQACLKAAECAKERAADSAYSKHDAVVLDDDTQQQRVLFTSLTATVAALLASGVALAATGGMAAPAIAAAFGAGSGAGGVVQFLSGRADQIRAERIAEQVRQGGIVLWARVNSPENEEQAISILRKHGAGSVDAHDLA